MQKGPAAAWETSGIRGIQNTGWPMTVMSVKFILPKENTGRAPHHKEAFKSWWKARNICCNVDVLCCFTIFFGWQLYIYIKFIVMNDSKGWENVECNMGNGPESVRSVQWIMQYRNQNVLNINRITSYLTANSTTKTVILLDATILRLDLTTLLKIWFYIRASCPVCVLTPTPSCYSTGDPQCSVAPRTSAQFGGSAGPCICEGWIWCHIA